LDVYRSDEAELELQPVRLAGGADVSGFFMAAWRLGIREEMGLRVGDWHESALVSHESGCPWGRFLERRRRLPQGQIRRPWGGGRM